MTNQIEEILSKILFKTIYRFFISCENGDYIRICAKKMNMHYSNCWFFLEKIRQAGLIYFKKEGRTKRMFFTEQGSRIKGFFVLMSFIFWEIKYKEKGDENGKIF